MARRGGFTLLEVVLATGIAVMLLGGLYVAVDMQLRLAQESRDVVQESTLSRALFDRMDNDGSLVVNLCDPARYRLGASNTGTSMAGATADTGASSATNASSGATGTSSGTTGTSSGATSTTSSAAASSSSTSSTSSDSGATPVVLPLGVIGDSETLHLFISRVPREALADLNNPSDAPPVVSDLRRVSYWLAGGDGGLARQEIPLVTADDALQNLPPDIDNESSYILADEVRSLNFQYFDGTDWQDSWDSTALGADGVTPIGSPRAIAVTIGIAPSPGPGKSQTDDSNLKTYRHVLVIPSANGTTAMSQNATGTTGTTGTGTTGSGVTTP